MSTQPNSGAAVRGLLLVLVAVVVGLLLLRSVDDTGSVAATATTQAPEPGDTLTPDDDIPVVTEAPTPTTTVEDVTTTTVADQTDTTEDDSTGGFTARPVSEVSIQVANSTTVGGAAGRLTDRFKALGYITNTPTNYAGTALADTRIYHQPGSLLEARVVAEVLELDPDSAVASMPTDTSAVQAYETPDVLIALGNDLAE